MVIKKKNINKPIPFKNMITSRLYCNNRYNYYYFN